VTTATTMAATTMTTTLCKGRRRRRENHDACEGCGCSLAEIVFVVDPKDGADGGTRWRRRLGKVRWCPMRQHEREHVECRNSEHVVKEEELSMLQGCPQNCRPRNGKSERLPVWTAMDRVRASSSVILWIGK